MDGFDWLERLESNNFVSLPASKCNENVASKNKVLWSAIKFEEKKSVHNLCDWFFFVIIGWQRIARRKVGKRNFSDAPRARLDKLNGDGVKMVNFYKAASRHFARTIGGWSLCSQLRVARWESDCSVTKYDLQSSLLAFFFQRQEKNIREMFCFPAAEWKHCQMCCSMIN